jgi:hypothetical protein
VVTDFSKIDTVHIKIGTVLIKKIGTVHPKFSENRNRLDPIFSTHRIFKHCLELT